MPSRKVIKILTVIGARPQFIKSATVSRAINSKGKGIKEVIVHTGQHYDKNLSDLLFNELKIPKPLYNLNVGSGSHAEQTSLIMIKLEEVVEFENPDVMLVYGDTNSTLAAAIVAAKKPCKLVHVEAGLRSFNKNMPEEVNRVVTDSLSDILYCPTTISEDNLKNEGRAKNTILVGDVMYDSYLYYDKNFNSKKILKKFNLQKNKYFLATIHRAENTDNPVLLGNIIEAFQDLSDDFIVILPLHPRTKKALQYHNISVEGLKIVNPVSYIEMHSLLANARLVITDSGGLQKEAYFAKTPCITIREETEWLETLEDGWNLLISPKYKNKIIEQIKNVLNIEFSNKKHLKSYGNGNAAEKIIDSLLELF